MDRRKALKNLGLIAGGILLFPACDLSKEKEIVLLHKLQVTPEEDLLLKEIVSTMIPEGDIPGADSLNAADFVWVMAGDMLQKEQQKVFMKGLKEFDTESKKASSKSFGQLNPTEQIKILQHLSGSDNRDLKIFLRITKRYAIEGFMKSKYIMTEIMPYALIPGTYGTCETIDHQKRVNINA